MRNQVDTANATQLQRLPGHADTYNALDFAGVDSKGVRVTDQARDRLLERLVTPSSIKLKVCDGDLRYYLDTNLVAILERSVRR